MKRRRLLAMTAALAAAPFVARAQPRVPLIAILVVGDREPLWSHLRAGLAAFGYVEGQNFRVEFRSAQDRPATLPGLAAELVALRPDIIVASETPCVQAAKQATRDIPIVMAPAGDPVGTGLVESLARPGGNVTGLSAAANEVAGKSVELLRDIFPDMRAVAVFADPNNPFTRSYLEQINLAGRTLGVEIILIPVRGAEDYPAAFAAVKEKRAAAVVVQPTLPRKPAVDQALANGVPAVSANRTFADMGGLLTYAGSLQDRYGEAAAFIDKILKGRKPIDLPVQQPMRFELVVNMKTAKALGVTIPETIMIRASDVIE
jgi:putative tryptophan/tyrosine transport system substrate-binding protein